MRDFVWLPDRNAIASRSGSVFIPRSKKFEEAHRRLHDPVYRRSELKRMNTNLCRRLRKRTPVSVPNDDDEDPCASEEGELYSSFKEAKKIAVNPSSAFGSGLQPVERDAFPVPRQETKPRQFVDYLQMQAEKMRQARAKREAAKEQRRQMEVPPLIVTQLKRHLY